ncbi:unnamed protein product [Kluyveromyces dobzhanskii CBS 2104]|uniref:WGS project CCBQ000000000 data, contig 00106 n=1 Tax=Kluyveromyces dobzhanskii CBS 2104 TaxID=1427455 RepID=A0A0A8L8K4_9SACH|nr:unnamed protein product [Kluyveromyces dobzhanskii CBS 2104]
MSETETPAKGTSQSIIAHMNKDHKLALEDFLYAFGNVPITSQISSVRLKEFELDHMTILFQHAAIDFDIEKVIALDPPMDSFREARDRLVSMAKEAASKRGVSHVRINEMSYPRDIDEFLIITFAFVLPLVVYWKRGILRYFPLPQVVINFISKDAVLLPIIIGVMICHAAENYFLLRPRLNFHRVPTDFLIEWYFFGMLEGYPTVRRFNDLAYQRTH